MTLPAKHNRRYPYNTGLLLATEFDIVLTNENSEPIDPLTIFKDGKVAQVMHSNGARWGDSNDTRESHFKVRNGMIRGYTRFSYCRAYSTDNVWWILKTLIMELKKRAFLSFVPEVDGHVACGHMSYCVTEPGIYSESDCNALHRMTYQEGDSNNRLKDNLRLLIGLMYVLLDRSSSAEKRRVEYGPFSKKEFRMTDTALTYQTPGNFWLFSPILSHLLLGAGRYAYFITLNAIEEEIWEGFESDDVRYIIHNSDYETAEELWDFLKVRLNEAGYKTNDNPYNKQMAKVIDFFIEYGLGVIGKGVYKNWRMARKATNYRGHFEDLPSWEGGGALRRVFGEKHPMHQRLADYMKEKPSAR